MAVHNTSISLGEHFTEFVQQQVESGQYATASEVIRASLRLLEHEQRQRDHLRALIEEGMADIEAGRVVEDSDELWEQIDREVDERFERADRPGARVAS